MSVFDIAGEQLEGTSAEEAHQRNVSTERRDAPGAHTRAVAGPSLRRAVGARRFRLQTSGALTALLILALAGLLPAQRVHIRVDGGTLSVTTRSQSPRAIAHQAGIPFGPADRIERIDSNDLVVRRAISATLTVDGRSYTLRTQAKSIGEALAEVGIAQSDDDSIYRDGVLVGTDAALSSSATVTIDVRRAVPFTVVENGQHLQLQSSRATVASALREAGVRVGPADAIQPPLTTEMASGMEVHVEHARPLVVTMPAGTLKLYTLADTVGEAVANAAVTLPPDYRLDPPAETVVGAGLAVHVIGVSAEQVEETERVESHTVYEADAGLPYGQQQVVAGRDGVLHRAYDVTYEDGSLTNRELASQWYDPEPADTIIYYSTATEPAAPPVSASLGGDWRDLVCSYDWDCDWALAVVQCESGGNPKAYNSSGYVGLFQIWQGHGDNLTDPATNVAAAYSLYVSGGPGNWPNCP